MSSDRWRGKQIYLYREPVDMRKAIDGLSAIVAAELGADPLDGSLYAFTNKGRDKVKLLIWHRNGFWVLYKRLHRQRFKWPDWFSDDKLTLSQDQLDLLLDGYDLNGMRPHHALALKHVI